MSDGSIGGAVAEGVKGIVSGTAKTAANELKEAGKAAVTQTVKQNSSQAQTNATNPQPYQEPGKDQKIAQIRSKLHNEMISVTPKSQAPQQPQGPIAEQNFASSQAQSHYAPNRTKQKKIVAVDNARSERGRGAKG